MARSSRTAARRSAGPPPVRRRATNRATKSASPGASTEELLLDAALTVFAEKGYAAASVRDIIRAANVTQPTLYYYCRNKLDLFRRLVRVKYEETLEQLRQSLAELHGCELRLRTIVASSFAYCVQDPRVPRFLFQSTFGPKIPHVSKHLEELAGRRFAIVREVVREGVAAGELRDADLDGLTLAFCCLMDQHINVLARLPSPADYLTPRLADWLVELFLRGASR